MDSQNVLLTAEPAAFLVVPKVQKNTSFSLKYSPTDSLLSCSKSNKKLWKLYYLANIFTFNYMYMYLYQHINYKNNKLTEGSEKHQKVSTQRTHTQKTQGLISMAIRIGFQLLFWPPPTITTPTTPVTITFSSNVYCCAELL